MHSLATTRQLHDGKSFELISIHPAAALRLDSPFFHFGLVYYQEIQMNWSNSSPKQRIIIIADDNIIINKRKLKENLYQKLQMKHNNERKKIKTIRNKSSRKKGNKITKN